MKKDNIITMRFNIIFNKNKTFCQLQICMRKNKKKKQKEKQSRLNYIIFISSFVIHFLKIKKKNNKTRALSSLYGNKFLI